MQGGAGAEGEGCDGVGLDVGAVVGGAEGRCHAQRERGGRDMWEGRGCLFGKRSVEVVGGAGGMNG